MYEYNMRRKCDFHVLSCNTSLFKRSVINMGIRMYNKIPIKIQQLVSFRDCKQRFELFLLDHPIYLLNEFLYFKKTIEPLINDTSKT